ncbi:MAG: alkaline phosphatase D family protein [bacterium]
MSKAGIRITRRQTLRGGVLAATGLAAVSLGAEAKVSSEYFRHGVASGDPDQTSVILWTRLSDSQDPASVTWQLSDDPQFARIRQTGQITTSIEKDFTVKVLVQHLPAGGVFYYRFLFNGVSSDTGRTRTLPENHVESVGLAVASCSNFVFGFFNAYEAIAADEGVQYVLHLGDYIYEYGADGWGAQSGRALGREHVPGHETVSLADYRLRHAQYKADLSSQRMHAAHPLIVTWDDHESTNNPWMEGAQNHQPEQEGSWQARLGVSLHAYYEWMPIREPGKGRSRADYWRTYRFGDLASLVTLETRHTARARQIEYADHMHTLTSKAAKNHFLTNILGAPGRAMLSAPMQDVLSATLSGSVTQQQPWRLIGNQIPMARMPVPNVSKVLGLAGSDLDAEKGDVGVPGGGPDLAWKGHWGLPFYLDTWDGYPWAREQFYQLCRSAGATDLLVLTGDSHSFWANQLFDDQGRSMGVEIGTAGISSPGDFIESGFDTETAAALDRLFAQEIAEVRWTDNMHQGYVRVQLDHEKATVDFVAVDTVLRPSKLVQTVRSEILVKQSGRLVYKS